MAGSSGSRKAVREGPSYMPMQAWTGLVVGDAAFALHAGMPVYIESLIRC
jgi:hypothetical protein